MDHIVALYEAFTGEKVLPVQMPLLARHLKYSIRYRLVRGFWLIPTGYVVLWFAHSFTNWWRRVYHGESSGGVEEESSVHTASIEDVGLGLRRTYAHHNLHEFFLLMEDTQDGFRCADRTVVWVNWAAKMRRHCEITPEPEGTFENYICDSCIFCISDSDYEDSESDTPDCPY